MVSRKHFYSLYFEKKNYKVFTRRINFLNAKTATIKARTTMNNEIIAKKF